MWVNHHSKQNHLKSTPLIEKETPTIQTTPKQNLPMNRYLLDQIRTMRIQESTTYKISCDYLSNALDEGFLVSTLTRQQMLSWAFKVVDSYQVDREVAMISLNYLDRFLSDCDDGVLEAALCSIYVFQLCAVACLAIALKNCARMNIDMHSVSEAICHGAYKAKELAQIELIILQGLKWQLNGPSAMDFVRAFLQMLPPQDRLTTDLLARAVKVVVQNASISYPTCLEDPSSIAYSSILVVLDCLDCNQNGCNVQPHDRLEWTQSIACVAGLKEEDSTIQFIRGILLSKTSSSELYGTVLRPCLTNIVQPIREE